MANNYGLFFARDGLVVRIPVNPEKIDTEKGNENDDYNVLSLGPIVVPRLPALKVISWESQFPGRPNDPWVLTKNEFKEPEFYIQFFEAAMNDRVPITYTPVRCYEDGTPYMTSETGMDVLVTSFEYWEQGAETGDFYYSIELTEYKDYTPRILQTQSGGTITNADAQTATVTRTRQIPQGKLYAGVTVKVTGAVYGSNAGESPVAQLSGLYGTVGRLVTADPLTPYPVMIRDSYGNFVGWVKEEDCQVVNQNGI